MADFSDLSMIIQENLRQYLFTKRLKFAPGSSIMITQGANGPEIRIPTTLYDQYGRKKKTLSNQDISEIVKMSLQVWKNTQQLGEIEIN